MQGHDAEADYADFQAQGHAEAEAQGKYDAEREHAQDDLRILQEKRNSLTAQLKRLSCDNPSYSKIWNQRIGVIESISKIIKYLNL